MFGARLSIAVSIPGSPEQLLIGPPRSETCQHFHLEPFTPTPSAPARQTIRANDDASIPRLVPFISSIQPHGFLVVLGLGDIQLPHDQTEKIHFEGGGKLSIFVDGRK